ncbi:MAG TPA: hypothetical protein VLH39_03765 [Magnetospirillaceae bacterium]|nr:hypothetical protein [Magnetospirillaceae bacterium]
MGYQFEGLANRDGFNASVRQIKSTLGVVERVDAGENLADLIAELLDQKQIQQEAVPPLVSMVLLDKFGYRSVSVNLPFEGDLGSVASAVACWDAVDLVAVYHHPDLGTIAINPKNPAHLARLDHVNRYELLVVYAGAFGRKADPELHRTAARALADIFSGKTGKPAAALLKGGCAYKALPAAGAKLDRRIPARTPAGKASPARAAGRKAAKTAPPRSAPKKAATVAEESAAAAPSLRPGIRMTPMYSVLVTNELFHNGNVEAWKRIIDSYRAKHPDLDVIVYYDRERITNLNALFKWGKVKRGTTIQFAVVGENISDVAKLLRYLQQGASHMFEAFLKGPVNSILPLF